VRLRPCRQKLGWILGHIRRRKCRRLGRCPVRRLRRQDPKLSVNREALELRAPAVRDLKWHLEFPGWTTLGSRHEGPTVIELRCPSWVIRVEVPKSATKAKRSWQRGSTTRGPTSRPMRRSKLCVLVLTTHTIDSKSGVSTGGITQLHSRQVRCHARCSMGFVSGPEKIAVLELKASRFAVLTAPRSSVPAAKGRALFFAKGLSRYRGSAQALTQSVNVVVCAFSLALSRRRARHEDYHDCAISSQSEPAAGQLSMRRLGRDASSEMTQRLGVMCVPKPRYELHKPRRTTVNRRRMEWFGSSG
jgi:hypothetical protein